VITLRRRTAAVGAAIAVAVTAVAVPALAQNDDDATDGTTSTEDTDDRAGREVRRAEHRGEFAEALAAELDLPVDEVTDAIDAVTEQRRAEHRAERQLAFDDRLDQAVEDGDLTADQADAIREAHGAGVLGRRGPGGPAHRGGSGGPFGGPPSDDAAA
jgi:hypothetical protein